MAKHIRELLEAARRRASHAGMLLLMVMGLAVSEPAQTTAAGNTINERVTNIRVRQQNEQRQMVVASAADDRVDVAQWGNWGNWRNWGNWNNWRNWGNWGNWRNF
jgi:hypothetical protein